MGGEAIINSLASKTGYLPETYFNRDNDAFEILLKSLPKDTRNQVYGAVRDTVNALNRSDINNSHILSSINVDKNHEILAIEGVSADNVERLSQSLMAAMQKSYVSAQNAYNLPQMGGQALSLA